MEICNNSKKNRIISISHLLWFIWKWKGDTSNIWNVCTIFYRQQKCSRVFCSQCINEFHSSYF